MIVKNNKNLSLAVNLLCIVAGMLMLTAASVPLYKLFCEVTGYGGTTRESKNAPTRVMERQMTVTFNADTDQGLPWMFKPGEASHTVHIGQQALTHYVAKNLTRKPLSGQAIYNVTPFAAGRYFVKIECFCFTRQTLAAGQEVTMPVLFYIDPTIAEDPDLKDVKTITLSYTFFPVKTDAE